MYVLDSSALLAYLFAEPGGEDVKALLTRGCVLGAVNLAEVLSKLEQVGVDDGLAAIEALADSLEMAPFDRGHAHLVAKLLNPTVSLGLGIGDRACLALASMRGVPAVTADRAWAALDLDLEIVLIR